MSQSENQPDAGTTEQSAPDGLMAASALAEEQEIEEGQNIEHRAEGDAAEADGEPEVFDRPDWFPAKFWDEKEGPDLENIVKSYEELQKQFSQGKHKAPDTYDTNVLDDAGYEKDDPIIGAYTEWAKQYGINQAAFDDLAGKISSMAGDNEPQAKMDYQAEHKALGNNADEIIKSNVNWADGLQRKGVVSEAERAELDMWGGSAVGQRLMQKVRQMTGDLSQIPIASVSDAGMSEDDFRSDIQSKMQDKRYGSDPKFTREVERMFEQRYK